MDYTGLKTKQIMSKNTRIRIALFCPSLRGGGAERVMVQLANEFVKQDLDVDLVLANAEGEYFSEVSKKVNVVDLKSHRVLASLPGLIRYLRLSKPTMMISTLDYANVIAVWAKLLSRSKTRLYLREDSVVNPEIMSFKGKVAFKMMSSTYSKSDGVIAISSGVKESLLSHIDIKSDIVKVIYNPVINDDIYKLAKEEIDHPWFKEPGKVVLSVGRLVIEKDYETLLRSFSKVVENQDAKLIILGEGGEREKLEKLIQSLGIERYVDLMGFVTNPFKYMFRSNLFVLSSMQEGLGNVLIEAMALGTRVIATKCPGGPSEVLENGRWGTLVPVGDVDALANAMEKALNNQQQVTYSSECLDRFDSKKIAKEYLSLLQSDFENVGIKSPI